MSHFTAQMVYQLFDTRHPGDRYLLETRIFEATDASQALDLARITGEAQTVTETDVTGCLVRKAFIGVKSVEAFSVVSGTVVCQQVQTYQTADAPPAKAAVKAPAILKLVPAAKQKAS
jgi:hypothetical protein